MFTKLIVMFVVTLSVTPALAGSSPNPVKVSDRSPGTIRITWSKVDRAYYYLVYVDGRYRGWTVGSDTDYVVSGLPTGKLVEVQIWARAYYGWRASSVVQHRLRGQSVDPWTETGFIWPLRHVVITQNFGDSHYNRSAGRWLRGHLGDDLRARSPTPVYAIGRGRVTRARSMGASWGKTIIIEHKVKDWDRPLYSMYSHLSTINVREGQWIGRGTYIGLTGNADGKWAPHLHLELRAGGQSATNAGPGYAGYGIRGDRANVSGMTFIRPSSFIRDNYAN